MREALSVEEQYTRTSADEVRILVVGAGVAGLTVAQLLRRDGRHPVLVERAGDEGHPGYMLALMPMVDAALDDLGVRQAYTDASSPLSRYGVLSHTGKALRQDSMEGILDRFGDYRGIGRGELMDVLAGEDCPVAYATTVTAIDDGAERTTVSFATPEGTRQLEFDLVIVADGIHSATRELVLGGRPVGILDTHWGGWVVWAPPDSDTDLGEELWGAGFFLGTYPVKGQLGVFLGGPSEDLKAGPAAVVEGIRRRLKTVSPRTESALRAVVEDPDPYYWPLTDCRAPAWALGRTVLLGDAAAGFLPTAGIGAGMAIESAWVLARMLRTAQPGGVESLLSAYEQTQRPRVEAAQKNSRSLAGLMFRRSRLLAVVRDIVVRFVSVEAVLGPIRKLLQEAPNPDAVAAAATQRAVR